MATENPAFVPKMIATDIDGTMLRSDGTLSERVRTALHHAAEAGIHVVPATGRPEMVATDVIEALGLDEYWVFANGAMTRNLTTGELIRGYWMSPVVAQGLIVEMRAAFPGAKFAIELEDGMAYESGFERIVPVRPSIDPIDDILDGFRGGRVQKVLVFDPDRTIDQLYRAVATTLGDHGVPSYSGLRFIEVAASLVTKALALDALCGDLGIESSEVAAFGDNHNDVAMLRWAGNGHAMANATDDAKDAAGRIIRNNNDDGLARVVEGYLALL
jgi:Cof subfamily protein (haloacid dehalogenase superfamily)